MLNNTTDNTCFWKGVNTLKNGQKREKRHHRDCLKLIWKFQNFTKHLFIFFFYHANGSLIKCGLFCFIWCSNKRDACREWIKHIMTGFNSVSSTMLVLRSVQWVTPQQEETKDQKPTWDPAEGKQRSLKYNWRRKRLTFHVDIQLVCPLAMLTGKKKKAWSWPQKNHTSLKSQYKCLEIIQTYNTC